MWKRFKEKGLKWHKWRLVEGGEESVRIPNFKEVVGWKLIGRVGGEVGGLGTEGFKWGDSEAGIHRWLSIAGGVREFAYLSKPHQPRIYRCLDA